MSIPIRAKHTLKNWTDKKEAKSIPASKADNELITNFDFTNPIEIDLLGGS